MNNVFLEHKIFVLLLLTASRFFVVHHVGSGVLWFDLHLGPPRHRCRQCFGVLQHLFNHFRKLESINNEFG